MNPQTGLWSASPTTDYQLSTSIELLKDVNFLLAKDALNKKVPSYSSILPTAPYSKVNGDIISYLLIFEKQDGFKYEVMLTVNNATKLATFIYDRKIGIVQVSNAAPTTPTRVYTPKSIEEVTKSSFFIPAALQVAKSVNNYQTNMIVAISTNEDEPNIIYYKTIYKINEKFYEVESLTKKRLRTGQMISEK